MGNMRWAFGVGGANRLARFSDRATLLFGGRQAGKTTLLRRIHRDVNACKANALELGDLDAAVYINLMTMDYEAGPSEFFRHLTNQLKKTCEDRIEHFDLSVLPSGTSRSGSAADLFHEDMSAIFKASGEVELRVLFLLDESQRVLGKRFPRGSKITFSHSSTVQRSRIQSA